MPGVDGQFVNAGRAVADHRVDKIVEAVNAMAAGMSLAGKSLATRRRFNAEA